MTKAGEKWIRLKGVEEDLANTLQAGIRPTKNRVKDHQSGDWLVHWQWIGWIAKVAKGAGYITDWSALPSKWQMIAAGASPQGCAPVSLERGGDPYRVLFLRTDAPIDVVKTVYKLLAKQNHPDLGGSTANFQQIEKAYREIKKLCSIG